MQLWRREVLRPRAPHAVHYRQGRDTCDAHGRSSTCYGLFTSQLIKKAKGKESTEQVATPWCPSNASMKQAQRRDPECMSVMQQLGTYAKGGAAALKTIGVIGVSEESARYLQLHDIDAEGLLR
jgi:hypothetical protein